MEKRIYTDADGDTVELERYKTPRYGAWIYTDGTCGVYLSRKQCLDLAAQLTALAATAEDDGVDISGADFTK